MHKGMIAGLCACALVSPVLAIDANGWLAKEDLDVQVAQLDMPGELHAVLEEASMPGADRYFDITIHWTNEEGIDWCMYLEFTSPDFTVISGGIGGTICDGEDPSSWQIDSISPSGGGCYRVESTHVGSGNCSSSLCLDGCKVGGAVPGADYGWGGGCNHFSADGDINGCS